jgi:hypothetical protein
VWIASWLAASLLTVAPGFFFRPHYFVPLMPAAALLVGVAVASLDRVLARFAGAGLARVLSLLLFVGVAGLYVQRESAYLFRISELELLRSIYRDDPFAEAPEIGRYLEAHTAPEERIAVLGSEPEILFYARRKPATGYIWTYPLMERQPFAARMQEEMQREIEAARPAHLVLVGLGASWGVEPGSDVGILEWAAAYATRCYERVGIADVDPERGSTVVWDADAAGYRPRTRSLVMIYRRSDECAGASAPQSSRSRASRPQPVR